MARHGFLLLTVAAIASLMLLTLSAGSASANPGGGQLPAGCTLVQGQTTCVTTTESTEEETRLLNSITEERTRQETESCQIGQSGQTGTQTVTYTDTYQIDTFGVYEITSTTTTTTVYQGHPRAGNVVSSESNIVKTETLLYTYEEETLLSSDETDRTACNAGQGGGGGGGGGNPNR